MRMRSHTHLTDEDNQMSGLESSEKKQAENVQLSGLRKRKKKQVDHGAETRKRNLLCQRAVTSNASFSEEMKSFIKGMFETSFNSFAEIIGNRFAKLEDQNSRNRLLHVGSKDKRI